MRRVSPSQPRNDTAKAAVFIYFVFLIAVLALAGCGEAASCWSDQRATFRPCDEVRRDEINREIDKREMERQR